MQDPLSSGDRCSSKGLLQRRRNPEHRISGSSDPAFSAKGFLYVRRWKGTIMDGFKSSGHGPYPSRTGISHNGGQVWEAMLGRVWTVSPGKRFRRGRSRPEPTTASGGDVE